MITIIIIIIIIHHETFIDLFHPLLIVCLKVSQVVFVYLVYQCIIQHYSWHSCSCSFLFHVVANFIFIISVTRQLAPLSRLTKFLYSFFGEKQSTQFFFLKMSSLFMSIFFILFVEGANFTSIWKNEKWRKILYSYFDLDCVCLSVESTHLLKLLPSSSTWRRIHW
jgi:hypothetical protein